MYHEQGESFIKHLDFILWDLIILEVTFVISYMLRHGFYNPFGQQAYMVIFCVLFLVQFLVGVFGEYYKNILRRGYLVELKSVFKQSSIVMGMVFAFMFLTKHQEYSRQVFLTLWVLNICFVYVERILWKRFVRKKMRESADRSRLLLICNHYSVEHCVKKLTDEKYQSFKIAGAIIYNRDMEGEEVKGIPIVSNREDIFEYLRKEIVDEVFLDIKVSDEMQKSLVEKLLEMGVVVHINMEQDHEEYPNKIIEHYAGFSVLTTSIKTATAYQLVAKRAMDIAGGIVGLLVTGLLVLIFAPIIYVQSPGSPFFAQERIGKNGRRFKMYKFRSMYLDAEERKKELMAQNKMSGLMFKMDNDPRIIPIGRFMRKLSLDEFPQFWNVLKGDMSLVGTRPPTVDEYNQYLYYHKVRLSIKPGVTGLWQVSGRSDIVDFEEVVKLDSNYILNWNLRLDIKILFKTVAAVFASQGAV